MAKAKTKKKTTSAKKGMSVKTFGGMSKKRMTSSGGGGNPNRLPLKKGKTITVQFAQTPDEALEYDIHVFQENGRWQFVPCMGEDNGCPLCASEIDKVRGTSYHFAINVYNLEAKRMQVLEGGKDLATRIYAKFERNKDRFTKRTFDITMFDTKPVTFEVDTGEEAPIKGLANMDLVDLQEYLDQQIKDYHGEDEGGRTALDDDDEDDDIDDDDDFDDEDDDPSHTKADLQDMDSGELKAAARAVKVNPKKFTRKSELIKAILKAQK
jgi:hypothetical protein